MKSSDDVSAARQAALARVERSDRAFRHAVLATAGVELVLVAISMSIMNFRNRDHLLMFVLAMLTYTTLAMGLVALGAYVNRSLSRILMGMELLRPDAPAKG